MKRLKMQLLLAIILFLILQNAFDISAQKPSNMSAVFGNSGRFEVFVGISGDKGGVYHTWQTSRGGSWNPVWTSYSPAPDDKPHGLVAGKDGSGRMVVAWISNGNIFHAEAVNGEGVSLSRPSQPFTRPVDFDGNVSEYTYLTIANNPDGMIEILALNKKGRVISIKETIQDKNDVSSWTWKTPVSIGGGDVQSISVTKLNNGLALVATGKDGKVYVKNQKVAGVWDTDPWTSLGGKKIKEAYAQESIDHQLEVVALGTDKSLYLNFQNLGTTSFSGWRMLVNQQTNVKLAPSIFFGRFKDNSLFIVSHIDAGQNSLISSATQYVGSFGKAFQGPNNGSWSGKFFFYNAVTTHQTGVNTADDLGFLSPTAFTIAADDRGTIHYFSCYRVSPRVEHYIDFFGASPQRSLVYEHHEHEIPDFPWQINKQ
jgi:hypothetical protein